MPALLRIRPTAQKESVQECDAQPKREAGFLSVAGGLHLPNLARASLCRHGKILLIWDGSPIHRSQEIKDFLKRGAAEWLQMEQLPGYAPDLNPDEGIWNYLKRVELGNVCCTDLR